jgi:hypothetical protein
MHCTSGMTKSSDRAAMARAISKVSTRFSPVWIGVAISAAMRA